MVNGVWKKNFRWRGNWWMRAKKEKRLKIRAKSRIGKVKLVGEDNSRAQAVDGGWKVRCTRRREPRIGWLRVDFLSRNPFLSRIPFHIEVVCFSAPLRSPVEAENRVTLHEISLEPEEPNSLAQCFRLVISQAVISSSFVMSTNVDT